MESSEYCKPAARSMATPLRSRAGCEAMAPVFRGLQVGSPSSPIVENRTLRQGETFYEGLSFASPCQRALFLAPISRSKEEWNKPPSPGVFAGTEEVYLCERTDISH